MSTEPVTPGYPTNVVPFDNHRRRLHFGHSSAGETTPRGHVVRLPTAASRALKLRTDTQTSPSGNGDRLTPVDYVVAFLLFLSTLTGPALVWTLVSFRRDPPDSV